MKVGLHSRDFTADGISFTVNRNPGFLEDTVGLISDAASALDLFDAVTVKQRCKLNVITDDHVRSD